MVVETERPEIQVDQSWITNEPQKILEKMVAWAPHRAAVRFYRNVITGGHLPTKIWKKKKKSVTADFIPEVEQIMYKLI